MFNITLGLPVILLTLAIGYLLLVKAAKQEKFLQMLGNIIGWLIICIAVISLLSIFYYSFGASSGHGFGGRYHHMMSGSKDDSSYRGQHMMMKDKKSRMEMKRTE